jgi:P-type Ca2+ transporter type 2C
MNWHQKDIEDIFKELNSTPFGLTENESEKRLREYGPNILKEKKRKHPSSIFFAQFKDFMILVLVVAAVISGVVGDLSDTIAIIVIVILNAVIGFVQEYRAEKAMAALKKMAAPSATVVRDGVTKIMAAADLVPGDVVILEAGRIVPSDMRLFEAAQLRIEEAALTGESLSVEKDTEVLHDNTVSIGDRKNMVFKGTIVSYGRGKGIVVSTGMKTELGRIATMLQEAKTVKTPLQKRLAAFGKKLSVAIIIICCVIFGVGIIRGEQPLLMLLTAISLAVAAIPEALPAVVTISLALGAKKMVKQNALIRKLPAVETLGSVTYICTDKTGTLTQNRMTVEEIYADGQLEKIRIAQSMEHGLGSTYNSAPHAPFHLLMKALALSNDITVDKDGKAIGDPTEVALYMTVRDAGFSRDLLIKEFPRIAEVPFDSQRKCMTTIHKEPLDRGPSQFISFTKGAVESILEKADSMLTSGGIKDINAGEILSVNDKMAADGLRVMCFAMRRWDELPEKISSGSVETGLIILGLVGMMDPPREEAATAVEICKTAGIKPVMITGDHPVTASTVAKRLGITGDAPESIITGRVLNEISADEFEERVEHIKVYARVAPDQKLKIIKALQDKGQFVAMTGDGVNDAPALKKSDIGIAMGVTGTDVAKEAAHMILLDDNFSTIVKAIGEGRKIYSNIRKIIKYLLSSNSGEVWTLFLAPLAGLPIPLLPIHILWINLMTDGLPALALSAEPQESDMMQRPPRHPKESIFAHGLGFYSLWMGLLMAGIAIFTQALSIHVYGSHWQTMVFTVLCLSQLGNALAVRSDKESLFKIGVLSNKPLLGALTISFIFQMATIYVPSLNPIFKTEPLSGNELLIALGLSSLVLFAAEAMKWRQRGD